MARAKAWLIASGKGGVGKSMATAGLAVALSRQGKKVVVVDADIGLRDQDAILGLENRIVYDILDVINKGCTLDQALVKHSLYEKLSLLPASQFARVKNMDPKGFRKVISQLKSRCDFILIDCPAGVERGLRHDDPDLGLEWPVPVSVISDKDASWPLLAENGGRAPA